MANDNSNSKSIHSIQLRGPWQVALLDQAGNQLGEHRIKVSTDSDWQSWHSHLRDDLTNESGDMKRVSFSRKFKWPRPQPPPRSVALMVQGAPPDQIMLNGGFVTVSSNLLDSLQLSNQLTLIYDLASDSKRAAPEISGVWLEISD